MRPLASAILLFGALLLAAAPASARVVPEAAQAAIQRLQQAAALLVEPDVPLDTLELDYEGELAWLNQGPVPSQPMRFRYREQIVFGAPGAGLLVRLEFAGPESSFQRRAALPEAAPSDDLVELTSRSPHAVLRRLLAQPRNLALVESNDGAAVITGSLHGRRVELAIGPDGLPTLLRYLINDDLHGDSVRSVEYLDYAAISGMRLPRRLRQADGGRTTHALELRSASAGGAPPEWSRGLAPAAPAGADPPLAAVRLADGIHLLRNLGGQDYHAMLVELDDDLMLLEAPAAIGDGGALARLAATVSPRPIVRVVPTHHHDDHSAGAAALAFSGAEILTTPGNRRFFETMAASPRWLAIGRAARRPPRVRVLAPGERIGPVQFLDIGSAGHAREHLVFYFPEHGLLFQSDMGRFNADGSVEPARPQTCHLLAQIETRGLRVDTIVGGHGRPGTMEDLRRAVAHPESRCAR